MDTSDVRTAKDRSPLYRRLLTLFRRSRVRDKAIYTVSLSDSTPWEMSANDALRMPLTVSEESATDELRGASAHPAAGTDPVPDIHHTLSDLKLEDEAYTPAFASESDLNPSPDVTTASEPETEKDNTARTQASPLHSPARPTEAGSSPVNSGSLRDTSENESPFIPMLTATTEPEGLIERLGARLVDGNSTPTNSPPTKQPGSAHLPEESTASLLTPDTSDQDFILLIEKNDRVRLSLTGMINTLGVRCLSVATAREALNLLSRFRPAAVLIDYNLPDMALTELIISVKGLYRNRPVPMIVMSEDDSKLYTEWNERLLVDGFLAKPFNVYGLFRSLQPFADVHRPVTAKPYAGAIGLIVERPGLRHYLRRILVRNGYAVCLSCGPRELFYAADYAQKQTLDAWFVQADNEELCVSIVDKLESYFEAPVLVGLDDLDLNNVDDMAKLRWNSRLLQKLTKLIDSEAIQVA